MNPDFSNFVFDAAFIHLFIKIIFLGFLVLYAIFALLVLRQVSVMNATLETVMSRPIKDLAWIHFLASLLVLAAVFFLF